MLGYPKGYGDTTNNYPIVRRGTTATPIKSDFDGKKEFLLDIPIYNGSSGSPVVLLNEGAFESKGSLLSGTRLYLLGIATQSIDLKTQNPNSYADLDNPLNIAVVTKSSALLEFKPQLFLMLKQYEKTLKKHN
jgi:hypothetical protein